MSSIFSRQKRSYYQVIDGDRQSDDDDPLAYPRNDVQNNANDHALPPSVHEATEVSFEGSSTHDLIKSNSRWDHVEDIDQFFSLVYEFHQGNGLTCIALKNCFALFQFILVVFLSTFLLQCVDYDVLFNNKNTTSSGQTIIGKRHIGDAIVPNCASHLNPIIVMSLLLAVIFWTAHLMRVGYKLLQLYEIQTFYHTVLEIKDSELSSTPWKDIVQRICKRQPQVHLIVNQEQITPLDIYQRILRYKNYMIAFVDHDILSLHIDVPFLGKVSYLSSGLRLNLEWLLFWGPWKGFALKDEYKSSEHLEMMAENMRTTILLLGLANLLFFPFVFLYQILFSFFSYADIIRRDPGVLGSRKYSNYGRLRLRHYNELDHELNLRLNRSYEFAARYMDQFISPTMEIVAKTVAFTAGSIFVILFLLTAWDEDVLTIEHVITVMTICGAIGLLCRSFIPNENMVFCQNFLMRQIVANIHYAPSKWIKQGQSNEVCAEFGQIFQLKVQYFVEELLSPIITPFILLFKIRAKASDIVLFYHQNTRSSITNGDVCSFSMLDLHTDSDPRLGNNQTYSGLGQTVLNRNTKRGHAKVELSLMNFVTQNPDWKAPVESEELVRNVRELWSKDLQQAIEQQEVTASTAFGPLSNLNILNSMTQSVREKAEKTRTPPSSPTTLRKSAQQQKSGQESQMIESRAGDFSDSATAALTASSMMKSIQQNSLIQAPTARYYNTAVPLNIQDRDMRALEMSMNALAITELLMSRGSVVPSNQNVYGSIAPSVPSSSTTPFRRPPQPQDLPNTISITGNRPNLAYNSIWGVPEESTLMMSDQETDDMDNLEQGRAGTDNQDLPPSAFNV
ncbi:Autophagy-related protein 9 [Aphelenchoides bicaudatus]|nr:Autophagy-related protein 9 [Aphelenchoides bicaudatus]